jgi:hypothetical protein
MFQPRALGILVIMGLILQVWPLFLTLAAILWWNVLLPRLNPFDALYNRLIANPRGQLPLTPAPAPRRMAQGMAATFMLAIGLFLLTGRQGSALRRPRSPRIDYYYTVTP